MLDVNQVQKLIVAAKEIGEFSSVLTNRHPAFERALADFVFEISRYQDRSFDYSFAQHLGAFIAEVSEDEIHDPMSEERRVKFLKFSRVYNKVFFNDDLQSEIYQVINNINDPVVPSISLPSIDAGRDLHINNRFGGSLDETTLSKIIEKLIDDKVSKENRLDDKFNKLNRGTYQDRLLSNFAIAAAVASFSAVLSKFVISSGLIEKMYAFVRSIL